METCKIEAGKISMKINNILGNDIGFSKEIEIREYLEQFHFYDRYKQPKHSKLKCMLIRVSGLFYFISIFLLIPFQLLSWLFTGKGLNKKHKIVNFYNKWDDLIDSANPDRVRIWGY